MNRVQPSQIARWRRIRSASHADNSPSMSALARLATFLQVSISVRSFRPPHAKETPGARFRYDPRSGFSGKSPCTGVTSARPGSRAARAARDAEARAYLRRVEALLDSERDHPALRRRQRLDRHGQMLGQPPPGHDPLRGDFIPELGYFLPPAMPVEGGGQAVFLAPFVEGDRTSIPLRLGPGLVDQDGEDRAGQRGPSLESPDILQDRMPGFLRDFLGDRAAVHDRAGDPDHRGRVTGIERGERRLVPRLQAIDTILFFQFPAAHFWSMKPRCVLAGVVFLASRKQWIARQIVTARELRFDGRHFTFWVPAAA